MEKYDAKRLIKNVRIDSTSLNITVILFLRNPDFGLVVKYKEYKVDINAPTVYANQMCGMCGNWDGNQANDHAMDLTSFQEEESVGAE